MGRQIGEDLAHVAAVLEENVIGRGFDAWDTAELAVHHDCGWTHLVADASALNAGLTSLPSSAPKLPVRRQPRKVATARA
jgi:hypothetical protein